MKKHIAIAIICALSLLTVTSCGKVDKPNNVSEDSGEVKATEELAEMVDGGQVKNSYDQQIPEQHWNQMLPSEFLKRI